jgi:DNA-binding winged helix-turn-helix (wHTH) protein
MSIYRFGPFEVRTRVRELYRSGTRIRLRGQPFQLLQALLNHPGEIVTREQMRDELWPSDTFVDFEHGINASLRKLRQALGDSALKPLYIETLPGVGYRFIAPFEQLEETLSKVDETDVGELSLGQEIDEVEETGELEPSPTSPWRRWTGVALAAGILLVFGLFLFVSRRNPRAATEGDVPATEKPSVPLVPVHRASSRIQGRVWVVSVSEATHVAFPPPNRIPDATFTTEGIAYIGTGPDNCYTLATFLEDCANRAFGLRFSGAPNSNLGGGAAGPNTALSGSKFGIIIEFTGTTLLAQGEAITILHDDGAALKIDGQPIPGFDPNVTGPVAEVARFSGPSGDHSFDLLYANGAGPGAWILFYPALY